MAVPPLPPLPPQLANLALPELLVDWQEETVLMTPVAAVFSLSAFKVLALCMGRGPLLLPYSGWWQFCGALMLPVIPAAAFKSSGGAGLEGGGLAQLAAQPAT